MRIYSAQWEYIQLNENIFNSMRIYAEDGVRWDVANNLYKKKNKKIKNLLETPRKKEKNGNELNYRSKIKALIGTWNFIFYDDLSS